MFVVLILLGLMYQTSKPTPTTAQADPKTTPIQYSDFQKNFMVIIANYAQKYQQAENELLKSALLTERQKQFETLPGDPRAIQNWTGVLTELGTNGDGNAYVTISLSPNLVTVSTWNNSFSDAGDNTLIKQATPIFQRLAQMKEGNVVHFSGKLQRVKNMTEEGKMTTPDFLFKFTNIEKIADFAN
jgi:hypothetical protein